MEICAIIPARGGSKGIPGKNIVPLSGKPLIGHILNAANNSKYLSKIFVSTDDDEIARIASSFGVEIIIRPQEISGDFSSSEDALIHGVNEIMSLGMVPDVLVFLQCTSPLTTTEDIDKTIRRFIESGADSAFAVAPFHYFLWKKNAEGDAEPVNHKKGIRQMRQDREPEYIEAGSVYVMKVDGFLKAKHRFFGKTVMQPIPTDHVFEIDEIEDLKIAECLLQQQQQMVQKYALPSIVEGIVFDFDGVFTDNQVIIADNGTEQVVCSRSDGMGIEVLKSSGIPMVVLSKEKNPVVEVRCKKMGIPSMQSIDSKEEYFDHWVMSNDLNRNNVIYVGNDVNDIDCLTRAGCGIVVADAHPEAKDVADIVLPVKGGKGAIRYLCDMILQQMEQ
ncbi:MAG TPA: acylneuraminate cytidylyltransferase [Methanoculleus sp.]|nr:acylneuraminate cytidylyltransferase [Methanoculleus sp.]